jgi:hypothetical protein
MLGLRNTVEKCYSHTFDQAFVSGRVPWVTMDDVGARNS